MKYLLDTNIVSEILRAIPSPRLVQHLQGVAPNDMAICSITLAELLYGAYRRPDTVIKYAAYIDAFAAKTAILDFDEQAARIYSTIRVAMEKSGKIIGNADLQIGSVALAHHLIMVTRNVKHFALIPQLVVENWIND